MCRAGVAGVPPDGEPDVRRRPAARRRFLVPWLSRAEDTPRRSPGSAATRCAHDGPHATRHRVASSPPPLSLLVSDAPARTRHSSGPGSRAIPRAPPRVRPAARNVIRRYVLRPQAPQRAAHGFRLEAQRLAHDDEREHRAALATQHPLLGLHARARLMAEIRADGVLQHREHERLGAGVRRRAGLSSPDADQCGDVVGVHGPRMLRIEVATSCCERGDSASNHPAGRLPPPPMLQLAPPYCQQFFALAQSRRMRNCTMTPMSPSALRRFIGTPMPDGDRQAAMDPLHAGDAVVAELAVLAALEAEGEAIDRPHDRAAEAALGRVEGAERLDRPVAEIEAHRRHVLADAEIGLDADDVLALVVVLLAQRHAVSVEEAEHRADRGRQVDAEALAQLVAAPRPAGLIDRQPVEPIARGRPPPIRLCDSSASGTKSVGATASRRESPRRPRRREIHTRSRHRSPRYPSATNGRPSTLPRFQGLRRNA